LNAIAGDFLIIPVKKKNNSFLANRIINLIDKVDLFFEINPF